MDRFSGLLIDVDQLCPRIVVDKISGEVAGFEVQLGLKVEVVFIEVLGARVCSLADPGGPQPIRIPIQDFARRSLGIQPMQKCRCLNLRNPLRNSQVQYARKAAERAAEHNYTQALDLERPKENE